MPGGKAASAQVARIVYASESTIPQSIYAEMERIRASALKHNVPAGIHTALLYQSGWFVQWKEGPADAMNGLMARVARDPRHRGLRVVHASHGPRLLSGPWSMAVVLADDTREDMSARVSRMRGRWEQGLQYSPPAVWRQLSTPLQHPGAAQQGDPDAFQRITVCDAVGQASFGLVRWLGQERRQPVVHRRFAGEEGLDVGTDYVDFSEGDRVARVIAMARKGLQLPLTRAFLADDSHVLLLLSGDTHHDLMLVDRIAQACAGLRAQPTIVAVAEDPASHLQPFNYAHCCGLVYLDAQADPRDPQATWAAARPYFARWRETANSSRL
jgi:hypothetical protein